MAGNKNPAYSGSPFRSVITNKVLNKVKFSLIFLTASDKVELETISRDELQLQNDGKHG